MKSRSYALIWVVILFFSCKSNNLLNRNNKNLSNSIDIKQISFLGKWENIDQTSRIFTINLFKEGSGIIGNYCSITNNGNKIDCSTNDEQNLKATFEGNILKVQFYSFFGGRDGLSEIVLENENIIWTVIKNPIGEFHCPIKDQLRKLE